MTDTIERAARTPPRDLPVEEVIDSVRHPVARRLADVLRSRSTTPRIVLIDDAENIGQAFRNEVRLDSLYGTERPDDGSSSILPALSDALPRYVLSEAVARSLFGGEKRARTFALAHAPRQPTLEALSRRPGDIVVLDGVRLAGNIGAITRTVCALGAAGLVLLDSGLSTTLDRRLVRASRGLVFAIPVVLATPSTFIEYARRGKVALATLTAAASEPLAAIRAIPERLALVLGGERCGVSDELDAVTSHRFAIPMMADVESVNVSVAAGIALYEHRRR